MKTNKSIVTATLKQVEEGKAFTNIEGLPSFKESDYTVTETDHRFGLIERLRNVVFPSLPAECSIENRYSGILATDLFSPHRFQLAARHTKENQPHHPNTQFRGIQLFVRSVAGLC